MNMDSTTRTDARPLPTQRIFHLDPPPRDRQATLMRRLYARSIPALERVLGLNRINDVYAHGAAQTTPKDFIAKCLEYLRIDCRVSSEDLARIPREGPIVVVANHPFGAIDGLMLGAVLQQARPDVKIMANFLLRRIPQLRELCIFVDPFDNESSAAKNLGPMRDCLRWLQGGGMLAAFPAGEVAHLTIKDREITDPAWNPTIAKIVRRTGAAVLPVYFDGHNGKLFQLLGLVHPRLRTALLPRAVFDKQGQTVEVRIGNPIPARKLAECASDVELLSYLRRRTFLLQHRPSATTKRLANGRVVPVMQAPIIAPIDPAVMSAELSDLPAEARLLDHDDFDVFLARAHQVPQVMQEIGRLREITFRATGEGTGQSIDLDRFDNDYLHLFIWHRQRRDIAGAYRLGPTDMILAARGKRGLYTSTLFDYQADLLQRLGPALELGRTFVRAEYQRSFAPLLLLWKGIGRYVCQHPRYKTLIGPVSISNDYQSTSRQIMVQFLKAHHLLPGLAELVRPRNPFPERRVRGWDADSVKQMARQSDDLSDLVAELEPDQKGIPVLLKQYLKLGAKLLAFNLDPDFSDVVDGLIVVDLTRTERRLLDKYMGKDGYDQFMRHHCGAGFSLR
jgi:putative hemolysin